MLRSDRVNRGLLVCLADVEMTTALQRPSWSAPSLKDACYYSDGDHKRLCRAEPWSCKLREEEVPRRGTRTRVERRTDEQLRAGLVVNVLHGDAHRQRHRPPHPLVQLRQEIPVGITTVQKLGTSSCKNIAGKVASVVLLRESIHAFGAARKACIRSSYVL